MSPEDAKFASLDELSQDLAPNQQYGRSKLAGILYTYYLTHHIHASHPRILANATQSGFVETKMNVNDIYEPLPVAGYGRSVLMAPLKKRPVAGSHQHTLLRHYDGEVRGVSLSPLRRRSKLARNEELGE